MKMGLILLLKRGVNTHINKCRHPTMFDNKVPAHFNRSGRFQNFSNKNLVCKTFMWFLLKVVSFMWFLRNLMRVIDLLLFTTLMWWFSAIFTMYVLMSIKTFAR